jgi:hypothetical protein
MFGSKEAVKVVDKVVGIADKLITDKDKKQDIASDIVQNEMVSGSWFVRAARPMIIYTGLFVILAEVFGIRLFILSHIEGENIVKHSTALMEYFLMIWSGVVSVYVGGRTFEKARMRSLRKSKKD